MVTRTNRTNQGSLPRQDSVYFFCGPERKVRTPGDHRNGPCGPERTERTQGQPPNFRRFSFFSPWGHPEMYPADPNDPHEPRGPPATREFFCPGSTWNGTENRTNPAEALDFGNFDLKELHEPMWPLRYFYYRARTEGPPVTILECFFYPWGPPE